MIDGYVIENAPVGIDDVSSVIQKNKFKLADKINPTEYPDAFTDNNRMLFPGNFSDEDWDFFFKHPIIIHSNPDLIIFSDGEPHVLSLETTVVLETIMANMKIASTEKEAFAFLPENQNLD